MSYGPDRWLYPIEITAENNGIVWDDNGFPLTTTITPGTYYAHDDVTINSTYPSLYATIRAAMVAESLANGDASTYTMAAATPTLSSSQTNAGLKIISTAPMVWFASGTINKTGALGYIYNGADSAEASEVTSPYTCKGAWTPPEYASDKRAAPKRVLSYSSLYTEREDTYALNRGARTGRAFRYEFIGAAHVFNTRANDAAYAAAGGLAQYDVHNALEDLWGSMALLNDIIVVQRQASQALTLLVAGQGYEVVRLETVEAASELMSLLELVASGGEFYNVNIPTIITNPGDYGGQ